MAVQLLKVYVETTIVSYLTARPSRDLVIVAHQQITEEWWDNRRNDFELYTSQIVIQESSAGDQAMARKRLDALNGIPLQAVKPEATELNSGRERADTAKGAGRCFAYRGRGQQRNGLPFDMELQAHSQRRNAERNRRNVPTSWI